MKTTAVFILFYLIHADSVRQIVGLFIKDAPIAQETKCARSCPLGGEMVCGTDGKTYASMCHLGKESCETKSGVRKDHPGPCDCPTRCKSDYKPVCAINKSTGKEKTCPNLCQFKKRACLLKKTNIDFAFKRNGPCKKMSKCPTGCQDIFAPVCGKDNKTYSSVCALKHASCTLNKQIGLAKIGRCQPKDCPDSCPFNFNLICGNDARWHPSECELKLSACKMGKSIKVVKTKKSKRICGKRCVSYCPSEERPVCGSDGITYANKCEMHRMNCKKGKKVKVVKKSKCSSVSNKTFKKK